jgi:hypothetical protein
LENQREAVAMAKKPVVAIKTIVAHASRQTLEPDMGHQGRNGIGDGV